MPDVVLKGLVQSLADVPAEHQSLYVEQEGVGFVLTEVKLEDLTGLKNAQEALRTENRELKAGKENAKELKTQLDGTTQQLHEATIVRDTIAALGAADANELGLDFLTERLGKLQKVIDGQLRIVDAAGTVRNNSAGQPMTFSELIAETKSNPKYAGLFKASGIGGTGSSPSSQARAAYAGNRTISRDAFAKLSPTAQAAHMRAGGTVAD